MSSRLSSLLVRDGLVATICGIGEKDRLTVLLNLLKQSVKVRIDGRNASPLIDV